MPYNIISKLSDPSIDSKIALIDYLIDRTKQGKSNDSFSGSIRNYLSDKERFPYLSNYTLIGPRYALSCLLGQFLYYYTSEENLTKQASLLESLMHYVQSFKPSKAPLLKKTTTAKLFDLLGKFGVQTHFLRTWDHKPLRVYYIPYEREDFNAAFYPHLNCIASYRPKDNESPEYIFLHEVGHLLSYNITGDPNKVPDSFIEFNSKMNPDWDSDLIEVFVDLFSLAVMTETEFAPLNPFESILSTEGKKLIKKYFVGLVSDLKYAKSFTLEYNFK
jgi:hypothetical protein